MRSRRARAAAAALVVVAACAFAATWPGCRAARTTKQLPAPATTAPASRPASEPALATLTVTVKNLRNHKGQLVFGVFRSADGFPNIGAKSAYWEFKEADADAVTFIAQLPPGRYGASVLHDENRSGEMNFSFGRIPAEGYGVTNNPKPAFRAATFEEAAFDLPAAGREMTISLQYF